MIRILKSALLLLLLPALAHAQAANPLETVFFDPALAAHDLDAHAANLIRVIEADPASQPARIALHRAMELRDKLASPRPLYEALRKLVLNEPRRCGMFADDYVEAYETLARDFDSDPAWRKPLEKWQPLSAASWIGPFAESGPAAHDEKFAPEVVASFAGGAQGAYGPVQWLAVKPAADPGTGVELSEQTRWPGNCNYVAYLLISGAGQDVVIRPELNGPGKVWLNGEMIADIDTRARDYPALALPAALKRGSNLLLVKVSGFSNLAVRLRGTDGQPLNDVVCEAPGPATAPVSISSGPARVASFALPPIAQAQDDARGRALHALASAQMLAANSLPEQAAEMVEVAYAAMPNDPLVRLHYLDSVMTRSLYSSGERRRIETELLDRLLVQNPKFLPAMLLRARALTRDDRIQDAADVLQSAGADNWRVALAQAEMFQRADWVAEWQDALNRAAALAPGALPVLRATGDFWSFMQHTGRQIETSRAILAQVPADRGAMASLTGLLLRTAQPDEALSIARQWVALEPGSRFAQERLAAALLAQGKLSEACAVYETLAGRTSRPEAHLTSAAEACLQQGQEDSAASYLERVVAASPAEHMARRQLQRLRGESEDFWSRYAMPTEEMLKIELTSEQFPRAASALLLDESIEMVYADGSAISYVRQVRKILTQDGVDDHGRESVQGELLLARTIQPDGTILEPITYSGRQVEFPGVRIGALIDLCWISRRGPSPWRNLSGQRFYFSDNELETPFAVSRYVVIAPRDMPMEIASHNLKPGDYAESSDGTHTVRTWDVRRPHHPPSEPFAPSSLETIPWIEFRQHRGWQSAARQTAERGLSMTRRVTALVTSTAAELVKDLKTDEAKARAIYLWVNEKFTTQGDSFGPHQAIKAMAGDRQGLFAALCAAAGVKLGFAVADVAPEYRPVSNDDLQAPDWDAVGDSDFDLFLFVVDGDDGKPLFVNLSERLRPFGSLPSARSRAPVIIWQQGRAVLSQLPAVDAGLDRLEYQTTIRLHEDGSAEVEGKAHALGERAWGFKEALRNVPLDDQRKFMEDELAGIVPGLELQEYEAANLGESGVPLTRAFKGKVAAMARARGESMTLAMPVERLGQMLSVLVAARQRDYAIALSFDFHQREEVRVVPPPGWRFRALPQDVLFPTAPLLFSATHELEEGVLVIRRSLALGPGRIEPAAYGRLTRQVRAMTRSEDLRLELEKVR